MLKLGSLSLRPAFRLRASRIKTWPSLWAASSGFVLVQGKSGGCAELESFQSDLGALGVGVNKVLKSALPNLKGNARELTPFASSPGSPSLDWQPEKGFSPQITGVGDGKSF